MPQNSGEDKNRLEINRGAASVFFILATFFSAYVFINPAKSGLIGKVFFTIIFNIFGTASYILPLIFLQYFMINIKWSVKLNVKLTFVWSLICLISLSILFEAIKLTFKFTIYGGWIGHNLYPFFKEFFETWISLIILIIVFLFSVAKFLKIPIVLYFLRNMKKLVNKKQSQYEMQQEFIPKIHKLEHMNSNVTQKQENNIEHLVEQEKINSKIFSYKLPISDLLKPEFTSIFKVSKEELLRMASLLRSTLADFDINAEVRDIIPGPVVTRYDLVLAPGVRIQAVSSIADNISLTMRTASIRIVPIPEKSAVGIEVPNSLSVVVGLKEILESNAFKNSKSLLTLALGKTTDGTGYVTDLISMPHLLIAGSTGSGKSVGIHTIILSILYKARPDEVKFMLIDPKHVEMSVYKDIPHIYNPCSLASDANIITDPREAAVALKKLVNVMDTRYLKFAKKMVRNIEDYNKKVTNGEKEFYIVVIIDEFADLMLVVQKEIESSIQRLAQMARAVGIHLILATQRPSVNVITGIIKANFPAKISFQTSSKVDSRVILDLLGAECLMGKGDMLFMLPGESRPIRLQGAYVSPKEAERIVSFIKNQAFPKIYEPTMIEVMNKNDFNNVCEEKKMKDLIPALNLINERKRISQDLLKANFGSSARATNILSILETKGFIAKPRGTNRWCIDYKKIAEYLVDNMESKH
ncbi:MAG: DNA translocase FtsK 4TM domain-containing protein [Endomicrobium sp.]|nr:DNA translocase FtsK 4TM domain-containing protein [Endomicrobium sp.]